MEEDLKPDVKLAVSRLKSKKFQVILLNEDSAQVAEALAKQIDIEEVIANVLPHEKIHKITELKMQGKKVGMVGDGERDALSLLEADVGFAMREGADIALDSGDIVLMRHSLMSVLDVIDISKGV